MNKILLFTLLATVIILGTLELGNLTFAQAPPIKEKIIKPTAVGPTNLWASNPSNKLTAVTDNLASTYITSSVNNQGQNFKYTHLLGVNTTIVEVVEKWKGYKTNPSGTTKVRSFLQGASSSYNDLTDFPLSLTISEFTKSYPNNPTANNAAWTQASFAATSFGWKQATATKPSFITEAWIVLKVTDRTKPTISNVPANIGPLLPTSAAGAVLPPPLPLITATDDVDVGAIQVNCLPALNSIFPIGVTTVTCTAIDSSGNTATAQFTVTVIDNIPPVITAPPDILSFQATAPLTPISGAQLGQATATDNVDPNPMITNDAPATFPLGVTTVTWTATDFSGNSATDTQLVTLVDTTAPSLDLPADITVAATSSAGAPVTFSVTASDAVDTTPTVSCAPSSGSNFPVGQTTVSCTATDDSGNQSSGSFKVHVFDVSSAANVSVGGTFFITVTDTGATGPVTVRVASPPDDPANFIDVTLDATASPGIFRKAVTPVLTPSAPNEIFIPEDGFADISIKYTIPIERAADESKTIIVSSTAPGNELGRPVTADDPMKFCSDRFVIETSGCLKILDVSLRDNGISDSVTATVESSTSTTPQSVILVEAAGDKGIFTTQYAITFTAGATDFSNPSTPRLHVVTTAGNTVTARYGSYTPATATIDVATIPTFGAVTVATANFNAGVGGDDDFDGIADAWETQSVSVVGVKVATGSGQIYSYGARPQIDDTAGNTAGTPYSAHSTASPNTINPGTGSGNSGGCFTSTNALPNPLIRDAYIEIDYMTGHKPSRGALCKVIQALAALPDPDGSGPILAGVKGHIQLDESYGFHRDVVPFTSTTVGYDIEQLLSSKFGKSAERSGKTGTTLINYLGEKRQIFHHASIAHDIEGFVGRSGYGEIYGNQFVVSLGSFTNNRGSDDEIARTIIHELGHNWGLDHQGSIDIHPVPINCAPNYLSVMNYLYQFNDPVANNPISFSLSALPTLDEITGLSEPEGLGQAPSWYAGYGPGTVDTIGPLSAASNPVDWNRNQDSTDTGVQLAVHNIPSLGCSDDNLRNLEGADDDNSFKMNFRASSQFSDGIHTSLTYNPDRSSTAGFVLGDVIHNTPYVNTITVPTAIAVNTALTLSGSIEDPGEPGETHTVTVNWGDGTSSPATLIPVAAEPNDETTRANIAPIGHIYTTVGKYTISVTVTDSTSLFDTSTFPAYIMVHGTSGRLVSTSSINTPAGAFKADPSFTGVASFSFQPDWRNNAVPTGQFHFDLSNSALLVDGTSFEWLYIKGNEAHFQGVGTATIGGTTITVGITGSAIDGNLSGGNGIDKVRIRIFDPSLGGPFDPGALIYDNMCTDYLGSTTDETQPSPLCVKVFEPANDATTTLGGTVGINP